ncbi:MAG: DUF2318 domain-containing protein [Clostridiales bacterium]|nr:DUF2318 domain-containing protein [Clostridiales bacterium]
MRTKIIWVIAGFVVVIAAGVVIATSNRTDNTTDTTLDENASTELSENTQNVTNDTEDAEDEQSASVSDGGIEISIAEVGTQASYYDAEIDGTTVEILAVLASDGTVHLAMNTCQVCNGSPYAYFEQDGDYFVCQNCGNRFSSDEIGLVSGGCNPVPVTEDDYTESDGIITVSESFLEENAYRFSKWKQF